MKGRQKSKRKKTETYLGHTSILEAELLSNLVPVHVDRVLVQHHNGEHEETVFWGGSVRLGGRGILGSGSGCLLGRDRGSRSSSGGSGAGSGSGSGDRAGAENAVCRSGRAHGCGLAWCC